MQEALESEHIETETDRRLIEMTRVIDTARVEQLGVHETESVDAAAEDTVVVCYHRAAISDAALLSDIRAIGGILRWSPAVAIHQIGADTFTHDINSFVPELFILLMKISCIFFMHN